MVVADPAPGRWCCRQRLAAFAPLPLLVAEADGLRLIEDRRCFAKRRQPFGRMCAFHGQMGMFVRALSYMLSHGRDGVRQASEDAVLSANYILASLKDVMSAPFGDGPCMHEALFDDSFLEGTGVTTLGLRQGDDRRGLSSHDHVFSAGGARRNADRTD
jgi:glycine dehydrogenase subunit 2